MATRPQRHSGYDARANFRVRKQDKNEQAQVFLGNLSKPPGIPERDGGGQFMEETQERSYALNFQLMREVGYQGAHSNTDALPIRRMDKDAVFAERPDRGTCYTLDWQLNPCYPIHPLSKMGYSSKPMENLGNIDPRQRPLTIDNYAVPHPSETRELVGC